MRAGCSKEQYREKFGALPTYTLLTAPVKPALQSGFVVAKVCVREAGGVRRISKNFINVYLPSARAVTRCAWAGDLRVRLS